MTVVSRLEDFKICSLQHAEEFYKVRKNVYINIQKTQDDYFAFRQSKLKAQNALREITGIERFHR